MADLVWPAGLFPYKTMFYLQPHVGGQESPLTRTRKVYGLSAPRWIARLSFRAGHGYDDPAIGRGPDGFDAAYYAARLDALIAEMEGGLNSIRFHDFRRPRPQSYLSGYAPGFATVDGAQVGATTMVIRRQSGWVGPSVGDYIGGDGRPHIITRVSPSAAGDMMSFAPPDGGIVVEFKPPLSAAIEVGAPLQMDQVTARFRLASEDAGQNEGEVGAPIEYMLDFTEDLLPPLGNGFPDDPGGPVEGPPNPEPM
ncbi:MULTISPECIES: hypothetical protein [unclassified Novosphingobium]|uniref:hypothetical protein n=1 Tax=unclassified Novosphingobium TaxID=2644732 RepID=UPI00190F249F|nr:MULTISPECIES: hypothetical protein [unclassified Novosphingobium]